ncbi:MAG: DUF4920 domain-containing protein [Crocinitomicaceae bacterium]|nr:DUF4920 domain-containing protein [Crocinitomicaceae bacterium]
MKKIVYVSAVITTFGFASCCGFCGKEDEAAGHGHDSTATTEEHHEEEESAIAFDGVDKGEYTLFGHTDITADGAVSMTEMFTQMEATGSFNDKVNVNIAEVCQKAGCWITFNNEAGEPVRVFFRDHFTIPIETPAGTEAVLYGKLVVDTLSVDFQKHLLDDAKEAGEEVSQAEYDAITQDKIETTFDCESILVKKAAH